MIWIQVMGIQSHVYLRLYIERRNNMLYVCCRADRKEQCTVLIKRRKICVGTFGNLKNMKNHWNFVKIWRTYACCFSFQFFKVTNWIQITFGLTLEEAKKVSHEKTNDGCIKIQQIIPSIHWSIHRSYHQSADHTIDPQIIPSTIDPLIDKTKTDNN